MLKKILLVALMSSAIGLANADDLRNKMDMSSNYIVHIDFTGTQDPQQKLYYNVKDNTGTLIIKNTSILDKSVDIPIKYVVSDMTHKTGKLSSVKYTITIYNLAATDSARHKLSVALPIYISAEPDNLYAKFTFNSRTQEREGTVCMVTFQTYGNLTETVDINKLIPVTITENKSSWTGGTNRIGIDDCTDDSTAILSLNKTLNISLQIPYQQTFTSLKQSVSSKHEFSSKFCQNSECS